MFVQAFTGAFIETPPLTPPISAGEPFEHRLDGSLFMTAKAMGLTRRIESKPLAFGR